MGTTVGNLAISTPMSKCRVCGKDCVVPPADEYMRSMPTIGWLKRRIQEERGADKTGAPGGNAAWKEGEEFRRRHRDKTIARYRELPVCVDCATRRWADGDNDPLPPL